MKYIVSENSMHFLLAENAKLTDVLDDALSDAKVTYRFDKDHG
jgi:hypothetical protein